MPPTHDIEAIVSGQLISDQKRAYIEADMAKTTTSKDSPPAMPTVEQMLSEIFPAMGEIDLAKMFELVEAIPPPTGMSKEAWQGMLGQVAAASFASGLAANKGLPTPSEDEHILKEIFSNEDAARSFKDLRNKLRITQDEIAKHAGVERSLIAKWEQGKARLPIKAIRALHEIAASRMTEPLLLTGNILAKLRKLLGITQAEFASKVGTTAISIRKWEKFGEKPLTRDSSAKVWDAYEKPLEELLAKTVSLNTHPPQRPAV